MPKLRLESKHKPPVSNEEYAELKSLLSKARDASDDHKVFLDLEKAEKPGRLRKHLNYVAEQEGFPISLRYSRKNRSMQVSLPEKKAGRASAGRMSADEARERILTALKSASAALSKSDILEKAGISPSSWNVRIKELLSSKKVVRQGKGRETRYRAK